MNLLFLNLGTTEMIIVCIIPLALFIYTLYHVFNNKSLNTYQRSIWLLIIIIGNILGWLLYWAIGKNGSNKPVKNNI